MKKQIVTVKTISFSSGSYLEDFPFRSSASASAGSGHSGKRHPMESRARSEQTVAVSSLSSEQSRAALTLHWLQRHGGEIRNGSWQ